MRALCAVLLWLIAASASWAASCKVVTFEDQPFSVCEVDMRGADLRLFLSRPDGAVYGHFGTIDRELRKEGKQLGFAMNAGMYHADRSPVGLYLENGVEVQSTVTAAGPGNFGLLPNGVFCIAKGRADVIETERFVRERPECLYASQSGPMLVIDGALHPRFLPDSTSFFIRNGVGTSADGTRAVFAISDLPVNFDRFGRFFRDALGLPNALYFDGKVSRLYAPELDRNDAGFRLGPIVGTVTEMSE